MSIYVDGVLKPPVDAGSLDGIPAAFPQPPTAAEDGYVVTYVNATGDLELQPGGGGGGLPVATGAGQIPVSDGAGTAYTASNAATVRTALGINTGALSARPVAPTTGDTYYASDFNASLVATITGDWCFTHGGPLAVTRGPVSGGGSWIAEITGTGTGPVGGPGTSLAIGLHVDSLPGAAEQVLVENLAAVGWILGVSSSTSNRLYLYLVGINGSAKIDIGDIAVGSYAIAISISTTEIRWSINGAAVGVVAISGTYSPPDAAARFVIGNNFIGSYALSCASVAWFQAWDDVRPDAALVAISAAHATYLPGASGRFPVNSWLAGAAPAWSGGATLEGVPSLRLILNPTGTSMGWQER